MSIVWDTTEGVLAPRQCCLFLAIVGLGFSRFFRTFTRPRRRRGEDPDRVLSIVGLELALGDAEEIPFRGMSHTDDAWVE